ncbi:D-aminoacyl-tRNA deacylase [Pasteuria penetrans]|uniref:D-aminoacyl-tRNA deacylase n=1 Tax=Pasteuria penetrans TaxID=86005 RepID=UPI000FA78FC9|nr:D-aminoacyl-tRNA deacylase [Pasteuria penetrans]
MRVLVQRIARSAVYVAGEPIASVGKGLLLLVGMAPRDGMGIFEWMARKILRMRVFPHPGGQSLCLNVRESGGELLVVPQFTLYAEVHRGNRPSFTAAAPAQQASQQFAQWCDHLASQGVPTARGRFGANMHVELVNDGPMTFWIEKEAPDHSHT